MVGILSNTVQLAVRIDLKNKKLGIITLFLNQHEIDEQIMPLFLLLQKNKIVNTLEYASKYFAPENRWSTEKTDHDWDNNTIRKWVRNAKLYISGGSGIENFFGDFTYIGHTYPKEHKFQLEFQ